MHMVPPGALPPAPPAARAGKRPPGHYLCFVATQSSPDIARIFMESGGKLNAAELPWETDFSTSAAPVSEFATLQRDGPVEVWGPVASGELADAGVDARGVAVVVAHPDFRLNISSSRLGTGINGTVVASVSGQASVPLRSILENDHTQVGLVYKSWLAHSSTVCISSARVRTVASAQHASLTSHTTPHTPISSALPAYANLLSPAPVRVLACSAHFCVFHASGSCVYWRTASSCSASYTETTPRRMPWRPECETPPCS